ELCGSVLRTPSGCALRCPLELGGDFLVSLGRALREMTRPFLGIGGDVCEASVQLPASLLRRGSVDGRGEQRMRKTNAFALSDEHARLLRLDQRREWIAVRAERVSNGRDCRSGERRRDEHGLLARG